jgi:hypothetical protein
MSTKQSVIEDSFAVMGILDEETGLEPSMLQRGLKEMNRMAMRWYDDGITFPYYSSTNLSDDTGCDDAQEEALANNLPVKLSAIYANNRPLSQSLATLASDSKEVLTKTSFEYPTTNYPSTLPRGSRRRSSGNGSFYPRFYSNNSNLRVVLSNGDPITYNGQPLYFTSETFDG